MTMTARDPNNAALRGQQTLPSLKTLERKLEEMAAIIKRRDHELLAELWRRAEQSSSADGYPASSMGSGVQSSSDSTSTEAAALAGLPGPNADQDDGGGRDPDPWPQPPDEVIAALSEACAEVSEAHGLMRRVDRRLVFAKAAGESHRGRQATGGDCLACDEFVSGAPSDRLRAGFCPACAQAWARFRQGRSEELGALRRAFIQVRQAETRDP